MNCDWKLPIGTDVTVVLPGAQGAVSGQVVRSDGAVLAVMVRQHAASQARLDPVPARSDETRRCGVTETALPAAAGGAASNEKDAAPGGPSGAALFGTATTSHILSDSKAIPFAAVRDGRLAFANPAFMSLFRADRDLTGLALPDLLALESREALDKLLADSDAALVTFQGRAIRLDGASFEVELFLARETRGGVSTMCVLAKDGTRHRNADKHLSYLAFTDVLTGLPNRALLMDRLRDAIVKARTETSVLAVLMADLDGFKTVNDTFGHQAGDIVLQTVAQRYLECVHGTDTLARLGGDEFCVLLPVIDDISEAEAVAARVVAATSRPIPIDSQEVRVGVSIGIALFPEHGSTGDAMLGAADAALYDAKRGGRNRYAVASVAYCLKAVSLPLVKWSAGYDVGVAMIDKQHRQLAEHINDLAASLGRGDDQAIISDKLATALAYTRHHFESEERLMNKIDYKDAAAHRGMHAQLLDELQGFSAEWDTRSLSLTARFLQEWLLRHVETADRDLAAALISRGIA